MSLVGPAIIKRGCSPASAQPLLHGMASASSLLHEDHQHHPSVIARNSWVNGTNCFLDTRENR